MRADRLIEILSELPADSEVFCWLATLEDYEDTHPELTPASWERVVASVEKWSEPYGSDLNSLILSTIGEITNA